MHLTIFSFELSLKRLIPLNDHWKVPFLKIVIKEMKPKHFPFCVVKPLTDEVSTSEQKMNPKREHFSCWEKGIIKIYQTVIKERDISYIKLDTWNFLTQQILWN